MAGKPRSYWSEFLLHPANQTVVLGGLALGFLAAMPFGWDALGLSVLALAAVETIGLAVVPGLPPFRAWVEKRHARAAREARREQFLRQLDTSVNGGSEHLADYQRMVERVDSLYGLARSSSSSLTEREVGQIDDLVVGYLGLCVSDAMLRRQGDLTGPETLQKKLKSVRARLGDPNVTAEEAQQLRRAQAEYEEAIARLARMASRASALEASLATMPVRLEELYQMVMTAPSGGDLSSMLEESVERLRFAETVDVDIEEILGIKAAPPDVQRARAVTQAQAGGRRL
jgi:hypothetical protein